MPVQSNNHVSKGLIAEPTGQPPALQMVPPPVALMVALLVALQGNAAPAGQSRLGRVAKHLHELPGNKVLGVMAHLERYSHKYPGMSWANLHP